MSEWKPFSTAPKDGTEILVWDGEDLGVAQFWSPDRIQETCCGDEEWADSIRNTWSFYNWRGDEGFYDEGIEPTHWMHLPDPPAPRNLD